MHISKYFNIAFYVPIRLGDYVLAYNVGCDHLGNYFKVYFWEFNKMIVNKKENNIIHL